MRIDETSVGQRFTVFGHSNLFFANIGKNYVGDTVVEVFYRGTNQSTGYRAFHPSVAVDLYVARISKFRNVYSNVMGQPHDSIEKVRQALNGDTSDHLGIIEIIYDDDKVADSVFRKN